MAVRNILIYAESKEALRRKCEPVPGINKRTRRLIRDLKDTLKVNSDGIGLSAPQIDVPLRVLIIDPEENRDKDGKSRAFKVLVNPEIIEAKNEQPDFDGCLSFPGLFATTKRPHYLKVSYINENGAQVVDEFENMDAVVVHHEMDHLDGVLFIDRVERFEDLYKVTFDDEGKPIRIPLRNEYSSFLNRGG